MARPGPGAPDLTGHRPRAPQRALSRRPGREARSPLAMGFSSAWAKGRPSWEDSRRLCFSTPGSSDGGREPEPAWPVRQWTPHAALPLGGVRGANACRGRSSV